MKSGCRTYAGLMKPDQRAMELLSRDDGTGKITDFTCRQKGECIPGTVAGGDGREYGIQLI